MGDPRSKTSMRIEPDMRSPLWGPWYEEPNMRSRPTWGNRKTISSVSSTLTSMKWVWLRRISATLRSRNIPLSRSFALLPMFLPILVHRRLALFYFHVYIFQIAGDDEWAEGFLEHQPDQECQHLLQEWSPNEPASSGVPLLVILKCISREILFQAKSYFQGNSLYVFQEWGRECPA